MMKKCFAILLIISCILSTVYGKTVFVSDGDIWTDVFYTEQVRLFGNKTTHIANWITYENTDTRKGIEAAVTVKNAKTIGEIYGKDSEDLYFWNIESAKNFESFVSDDMSASGCEISDIKEWNGFLFVLVSGRGTVQSQKTYTDYNGESKTYTVSERTDNAKKDSYLYVFDIKSDKNYGEALYAKYSKDDMGLADFPQSVMENINITDDYIYVTVNTGSFTSSQGDTAYKNVRGIAVFENNIKRGEEAVSLLPLGNLPYNISVIQRGGANRSLDVNAYKSEIIGSYIVTWYDAAGQLLSNDLFFATPISGASVGETKTITGTSLSNILRPQSGEWSEKTEPKIAGIEFDGTRFYFLISYGDGELNYLSVYKTDFSNPTVPVLEKSCHYLYGGGNISSAKNIYKYEDRIYIAFESGIDVIDCGSGEMTKLGTIPYDKAFFGTTPTSAIKFVVIGKYMYAWFNVGAAAYDVKAVLSDDGLSITESKVGVGAKQKPYANAVIFGDRIYIPAFRQSPAMYKPCVAKIDMSKVSPVSLNVNEPPSSAEAPYILTGSGQHIEYVYIEDNGTVTEVKTKTGEDGTKYWQYEISEEGEHNITVVGAIAKDCKISELSEQLSFSISGAKVNSLNVIVTRGENEVLTEVENPAGASGNIIVAVYESDKLYDIAALSTNDTSGSISVSCPLSEYEIKTFFVGLDGKIVQIENTEGVQ